MTMLLWKFGTLPLQKSHSIVLLHSVFHLIKCWHNQLFCLVFSCTCGCWQLLAYVISLVNEAMICCVCSIQTPDHWCTTATTWARGPWEGATATGRGRSLPQKEIGEAAICSLRHTCVVDVMSVACVTCVYSLCHSFLYCTSVCRSCHMFSLSGFTWCL